MEDDTFTPTLILVGIRLGIDRVTPAYWEALKESLKLPQSIGIAGYVFFSNKSSPALLVLTSRLNKTPAVVHLHHIISSPSKMTNSST